LHGYDLPVSKKAFLGFRLDPDLKGELEEISGKEERSISQICEILLRTGVDAYKKEGSKYFQRHVGRGRKEQRDE
jgi:hypothetical protein